MTKLLSFPVSQKTRTKIEKKLFEHYTQRGKVLMAILAKDLFFERAWDIQRYDDDTPEQIFHGFISEFACKFIANSKYSDEEINRKARNAVSYFDTVFTSILDEKLRNKVEDKDIADFIENGKDFLTNLQGLFDPLKPACGSSQEMIQKLGVILDSQIKKAKKELNN